MPKYFDTLNTEDGDTGAYTDEDLVAAADSLARDESGQGSFGGLATDDNTEFTPTDLSDPNKVIVPRYEPGAGSPFKGGAIVDGPRVGRDAGQRELDPRNFGDFFRSNIYGGLDARYVTGKRPMTLFDYATDVLAAYGGEDLGKRNAALIRSSREGAESALKSQKYEQQIRTGRAQERASDVQARRGEMDLYKEFNTGVEDILYSYDSDLWGPAVKDLMKRSGVDIPGPQVQMITRWMEKARGAGVSNPSQILENPENYDPALVNLTRFTFRNIQKLVDEHQQRQTKAETEKAALGAAETRLEGDLRTQEAIDAAVDMLTGKLQTATRPEEQYKIKAQIQALQYGGAPAIAVLNQMSGIQTSSGRGAVQQRVLDDLINRLGVTPTQAYEMIKQIEQESVFQRQEKAEVQKKIKDVQGSLAQGKSYIEKMRDATLEIGLPESVADIPAQQLKNFWLSVTRDPQYTKAIETRKAMLSQISRSLGEKGVLTDYDVARVESAIAYRWNDTAASYAARMNYIVEAMNEGAKALTEAINTGYVRPVDMRNIPDTPLEVSDSEYAAALQRRKYLGFNPEFGPDKPSPYAALGISEEGEAPGATSQPGMPWGSAKEAAEAIGAMPPGPERDKLAREAYEMFKGR